MFKRIKAFLLGMREFRQSYTWADPARTHYDDFTALDRAYEWGREWAHRLTLRHFD